MGNPVWSCLKMNAQPIRHEMAVTLIPHLSKQSSSVFMNSNEKCFFYFKHTDGDRDVWYSVCIICNWVNIYDGCRGQEKFYFKYFPFKPYNLTLKKETRASSICTIPRKHFLFFLYPTVTPVTLPYWMAHIGPRQLAGSSARHLTSHTHTCPPPTSITGPHSVP